jgi:starch phosphorylase
MTTKTILDRTLPPELLELADLSMDLRWMGSQLAGQIWAGLDAETWERTKNPYIILLNTPQKRLEEAARDEELKRQLNQWLERRRHYMESGGWFAQTHPNSSLHKVAYFSMEFGLSEALPIYSGGLGMLAGDHLKSCSDVGVPLVGVGLLYQQGYFRQVVAESGWQLEAFPYNDPGSLPVTPLCDQDGSRVRIGIELPGRTLQLRVWQARVGKTMLYLLDTNDPLNSPWDRGISANLYAAGKEKRFLQEMVLGIGGWLLLEQLGIEVEVCHLNEGHAAFAVLARAVSYARRTGLPFEAAWWATRAGNVFTTHTPVAAAFDQFPPDMVCRFGQRIIELSGLPAEKLLSLGRQNSHDPDEPFNMAYLAIRGCGHVNGVSRLHGQVSRQLFAPLFAGWPVAEVPVSHVTNGIHVPTWDSAEANQLWSEAFGAGERRWVQHLEDATTNVKKLPLDVLWNFRARARNTLVDYVRRRLARQYREHGAPPDVVHRAEHVLDPNVLTIGFARRFTEYKRPNLLLHDVERLVRMIRASDRAIQLIIAGKAHPNDDQGKAMVQAMVHFARREDVCDRVVFLEDYDMVLAQHLVGGIDVWLNTPRRPAEACGTSGMKVVVNGGLHLSQLDGWWDEAYAPNVGWAIDDGCEDSTLEVDVRDALRLYEILEQQVIPEFYDRDADGLPTAWVERIQASMSQLTAPFSSDRMVQDYVNLAYLPAAQAFLQRTAKQGQLARDLTAWHEKLDDCWRNVRFGAVHVEQEGEQWLFTAQLYLGELNPEQVRVELFADSLAGEQPVTAAMILRGPLSGSVQGFQYRGCVSADRPAEHYTARIMPFHPAAQVPLEAAHICWQH